MKELKWNVYTGDINGRTIRIFNIFDHYYFKEECDKAFTESHGDFSKFEKAVEIQLSYYYQCKCEWEIILSGFPPSKKFNDMKIDVYNQVKNNWDVFIDYVWKYYCWRK